MQILIKNKLYIINARETIESFLLELKKDDIDYKKLRGNDWKQFGFAMLYLKDLTFRNLKTYRFTYKQYLTYISQWFDKDGELIKYEQKTDPKFCLMCDKRVKVVKHFKAHTTNKNNGFELNDGNYLHYDNCGCEYYTTTLKRIGCGECRICYDFKK